MKIIKYKKNQTIHGWKIKQAKRLPDLKLEFIELIHIATGARYVHIDRKDSENVFCVAFKTIPEDSSGIAHILEHTVLTGSKNYPVRDPFFSMIKRSMNTFMNAFTGNDWTAYPFASENKKDYYNLMAVYLDAAFYPMLTELNFKQEGIRLEFENDELKYKGVVYNEMKGSLSSPERVMEEELTHSLFPTNSYRFNSGGDPREIPNLSVADLRKFHARYYHPSNAFFYSYGDLPLSGHLKFLDKKVMQNFSALKIASKVPLEKRFARPKKLVRPYPIESGADTKKKYQAVLAWLVAPIADAEEVVVLELLEDILLENPASPLRRALMESGLGSDLVEASGFNSELKEGVFAVGLKDIEKVKAGQVRNIVYATLKKIVKTGINPDIVASSIQKLEITHNEASSQPYPYGLKLWFRFIIPYIHDGDPLAALSFAQILRKMRVNLKQNNFLEKKIEKYFLKNKHEIMLILEPDKNLQAQAEKVEREKLAKIKAGLSQIEKSQIIKEAEQLKVLQEKKENVDCLPSLGIKDIPVKIKKIKEKQIGGARFAAHYSADTNGLFYWSALFPISGLSYEELVLIPLFCHVLPLLGTKKKSYLELAEAISRHTGGIGAGFQVASDYHKQNISSAYVTVASKCLAHSLKEMYALCQELITEFDFSDISALRKFVCEYRANLESGIVEEGHILAMSMASKNLSKVAALKELWNGLGQFEYIKKITEKLDDKELQNLANKLAGIGKKLFRKENIRILHIGENKDLEIAKKMPVSFFSRTLLSINSGGNSDSSDKPWIPACAGMTKKVIFSSKKESFLGPSLTDIIKLDKKKQKTGRYLATSVSFVAASFKAVDIRHADSPKLAVLSKLIGRNYLHSELREKGGAYGGFARYDNIEGIFSFGSYRDPHIKNTLSVYAKARDYALETKFSQKEIEEAILQVCSDQSRPASPAEEARGAFYRKLFGISDQDRLTFKKRVLQVKESDIKQVAKKYLKNKWQEYDVAVISNREKLEKTNRELAEDGFEINAI